MNMYLGYLSILEIQTFADIDFTWVNADLLSVRPLKTNFREIEFKKVPLDNIAGWNCTIYIEYVMDDSDISNVWTSDSNT